MRSPYPLRCRIFSLVSHDDSGAEVETHGPLGTLWAGLGLGAFYTALIWVNLLLGHMLTPLFILPLTWVQDAMAKRKAKR
jgi:hypothetical protein